MTSPLPPDLAPSAAPQVAQGASAKPAATPAPAASPAPAKAAAAAPEPAPIPTGFPEPVTPDEPREGVPGGMVRLATVPPVGSLTVPPLDEGGEPVVITIEGTDVDQETAERAREAAGLAGLSHRLIEL